MPLQYKLHSFIQICLRQLSTASIFHSYTLVATHACALTNGEKTHINAVHSSQMLYFHTICAWHSFLSGETANPHTCPSASTFKCHTSCYVMMHFQVPGIAWKPSQFKPAEEQTSSQRSWSGNNQSANEESRGCRCCANNEESQCCRRTTVIINNRQELVFCQIPWCLSWPFLL